MINCEKCQVNFKFSQDRSLSTLDKTCPVACFLIRVEHKAWWTGMLVNFFIRRASVFTHKK